MREQESPKSEEESGMITVVHFQSLSAADNSGLPNPKSTIYRNDGAVLFVYDSEPPQAKGHPRLSFQDDLRSLVTNAFQQKGWNGITALHQTTLEVAAAHVA